MGLPPKMATRPVRKLLSAILLDIMRTCSSKTRRFLSYVHGTDRRTDGRTANFTLTAAHKQRTYFILRALCRERTFEPKI